ncbi:MAG: hypothetical protein IJH55_02675, partial [Romboutsia sp.]|nr:hypothetical protein [Romboutsia sp.]
MPQIKTTYDSNNPNGIIDEAERGRQLYNKIKSESDYSMQGYIKAQKQLAELEKKIRDVQNVAENASGVNRKRLDAYISELENEQTRLTVLSNNLKEKLGAESDEQMQKIADRSNKSIDKLVKKANEEIKKLEDKKDQIEKDSSLSEKDKKEKISKVDKKIDAHKTEIDKLNSLRPTAAIGLPGDKTSALIEGLGNKSPVGSALSLFAGGGFGGKVESVLDSLGTNIPMLGN